MDSAVNAGVLAWGGLFAFLALMIVVDLRVGSAQKHMTVRTAGIWSAIWIGMAMLFGVGLGWLPTSGADEWRSVVMPAIALGGLSLFLMARTPRRH